MKEDQSTFWSEEHLASLSVLQDCEKDWKTLAETSCSSILDFLIASGPNGWSGRTSPEYCHQTRAGILEPSSEGWRNSGMGSPTGFLTLGTLEFPSDAVASSLSDILETGDLPQRYFLSATACRGILRRAGRRGKSLPPSLQAALESAALETSEPKPTSL